MVELGQFMTQKSKLLDRSYMKGIAKLFNSRILAHSTKTRYRAPLDTSDVKARV